MHFSGIVGALDYNANMTTEKFCNGSEMPISVFFKVVWQMGKLDNIINNCMHVLSTSVS